MLNKLLKRCMPWMDKGRWYHVEYKTDSNNQLTYVKYDNIFSSHEITSGSFPNLKLTLDVNHRKLVIKDYKFMEYPDIDDPLIDLPAELPISAQDHKYLLFPMFTSDHLNFGCI